jgi:5-methylcytosine-specific restriction endonuclease McrA
VSTVHNGIKPSQRARILLRDGRCVICGSRGGELGLHVGHLVPVAGGLAAGLTELELNDDENLAAMCAECNVGLGEAPPPLWITVPLLRMRLSRR